MAGRDTMTIEEVVGQVLTTRERSVMGAMKEPYDVLFAVKLTWTYEPLRAIEVPRAVLERYYAHGSRTHWTKCLEADTGVRRIPREELPN
jgi:hypothetical protein